MKVMLAKRSEGVEDAFETVAGEDGKLCVQFKYDGMRVQIHRKNGEVTVYTRRLEDVTEQFPDIVEAVQTNCTDESFIIEGEAVAYNPETGERLPFQKLSRRIKRKYDINKMAAEIPVTVFLFDCLYRQGESLLSTPYRGRWDALGELVAHQNKDLALAHTKITDKKAEVQGLMAQAEEEKQEGLMAKNLDAPYKPGSRVGYMVKLKQVMETLDLVIVAADWGEGKRSDWLASFTLACRVDGEFKTIGKMATGLTDEEFQEMTDRLEPLIVEESGRHVKVQPKIVVEVAYEEIQKSPTYESGYALRFPRLVQVREDMDPENSNDIEKVENLYETQQS